MDNESKKPCAPVEEESRDYNELGLYLHGKTMQTAMELWEMLPGWMEARRMVFVDPEYNRRISELIARLAEPVLKVADGVGKDTHRLGRIKPWSNESLPEHQVDGSGALLTEMWFHLAAAATG